MTVDYELDFPVARVFLNRPHRLNAVVPDLVADLGRALDRAAQDRVRALVLAGRGRAFCAGHDLKEDDSTDDVEVIRELIERIQDITRKVRRSPFPVIAAVHGYALGAGCEFALCSDLVVAARDAVFGFPEVSVGLSVTGGISHILPWAVGPVRAKQLVLLGERFTAEEAYSWGLVNAVTEPENLLPHANGWAQKLASLPPHALAVAKRTLDRGPQVDLETALQVEIEAALSTRNSAEAREAATVFRNQHKTS
jgi:2-(1,2-epoxy-1,2-dihydrophenyl)acetyl-CoA isomerase